MIANRLKYCGRISRAASCAYVWKAGRTRWARYVNERWADNKTWETLQLHANDTVEGTIASRVAGGYFVRLAHPDIDVWLSEREVPWADGSLGEDPRTEGAPRFPLEMGDPVRGLVTYIHFPPNHPAISIRRYLEKQEQRTVDSMTVETHDPASQLRFSAHILGDLAGLRQRLAPRPPLEGKRLLVIDDDREVLQAMVMLLEENGAHTRAIEVERRLSDAIESVQRALDEQDWDLMLIDYSLPGKGEGLRLAEHLKKRQRPPPRMLLFSGYPLESQEAKHLESSGIDGFMCKPLRLDRLLACLAGDFVWESGGIGDDTRLENEGSLPAPKGGACGIAGAVPPGLPVALCRIAGSHIAAPAGSTCLSRSVSKKTEGLG